MCTPYCLSGQIHVQKPSLAVPTNQKLNQTQEWTVLSAKSSIKSGALINTTNIDMIPLQRASTKNHLKLSITEK